MVTHKAKQIYMRGSAPKLKGYLSPVMWSRVIMSSAPLPLHSKDVNNGTCNYPFICQILKREKCLGLKTVVIF